MKKTAILLIALFFLPVIAHATAQQLQNVNIQILQLNAQLQFNNQDLLDTTRRLVEKAQALDKRINELLQQRQELMVPPLPAPEPVEPDGK